MAEALAPYQVVELGGGVAAAYCTKLFADFGAHVRKVESIGGDPLRNVPPLVEGQSTFFSWLNTNKHSHSVSSFVDLSLLQAILNADLLIDARPWREFHGAQLNHAVLQQANPRLVIVAISWFGESGPYADYSALDSACWSWAGLVKLVGPKEGPPALLPGYPAQLVGGLSAFNAALVGLIGRASGARRFSLSIHESNVVLAEYQVALGTSGMPTKRLGINRFSPNYPLGIFKCNEGWLGITIVTPAQWQTFCELFGMEQAAQNPAYLASMHRVRDADSLDAQFVMQLSTKSAEHWFEVGRKLRLPFVIVPSMKELLEQGVHRQRKAFVPVSSGGTQFQAPALPQRLMQTPARSGGLAPRLGKLSEPQEMPESFLGAPALPMSDRPLAGISVLDLTMGWAGPLVTRQLADLGAEIIKVEACQYPDWWRGTDFSANGMAERFYEKRPPFLMMNRNKKGITLDLSDTRGATLLKQLVSTVDAVTENYSQGVLPKLGLDYASLNKHNSELVMMSMPAFGARNDWSDVRAYGSTLEQASGLPTLVGQASWPPTSGHVAFGDPIGGLNATAALLIGLDYKRRTGIGQHIDISQVECMLSLAAHAVIEQSACGHTAERLGNRSPHYAPHGCFQCAGEDEWVFVAAASDGQWADLCAVTQLTVLASDRGLVTLEGRKEHEDEIDAALGVWTQVLSANDIVKLLQTRGICAATVVSPFDLPNDEHLLQRGFWQTVSREIAGSEQPQPSLPFRQSASAYLVRTPAPTLGVDNQNVLRERLQLAEKDIETLRDAGVIGELAVPAALRGSKSMKKG